ncbi:MAG: hypothetical protein PHE65_03945, partial [Candidatus Omnitrophica bacterium]|nr:hypothetical protein [Candidatus Omnitrophota bacterium]
MASADFVVAATKATKADLRAGINEGDFVVSVNANITEVVSVMGAKSQTIRQAGAGETAHLVTPDGRGFIIEDSQASTAIQSLVNALAKKLNMDFSGTIVEGLKMTVAGKEYATDLLINATKVNVADLKQGLKVGDFTVTAAANITDIAKALGIDTQSITVTTDRNGTSLKMEGKGADTLKAFVERVAAANNMSFSAVIDNGLKLMAVDGAGNPVTLFADLVIGVAMNDKGVYTANASGNITDMIKAVGADVHTVREAAAGEKADFNAGGKGFVFDGKGGNMIRDLVRGLSQHLRMNFTGIIDAGLKFQYVDGAGKAQTISTDLIFNAMRNDAGEISVTATANMTEIVAAMGIGTSEVREARAGETADFMAGGKGYKCVGQNYADVKTFAEALSGKLGVDFSGVITNGLHLTIAGADGKPLTVMADIMISAVKDDEGLITATAAANISEIVAALGVGAYEVSATDDTRNADFVANGKAYRVTGAGGDAIRDMIKGLAQGMEMSFSGVITGGLKLNVSGKTVQTDLVFSAGKADNGDITVNASADVTAIAESLGVKNYQVREAAAGEKADVTDPATGRGFMLSGEGASTMRDMVKALAGKLDTNFSGIMSKGLTFSVKDKTGKTVTISTNLVFAANRDAKGSFAPMAHADLTEVAKAMGLDGQNIRAAAKNETADLVDDAGRGYVIEGSGTGTLRELVKSLSSKMDTSFSGVIKNALSITTVDGAGKPVIFRTNLMLTAAKNDSGAFEMTATADITEIASALGAGPQHLRPAREGETADFTDERTGRSYVIDNSSSGAVKGLVKALGESMGVNFSGSMKNGLRISMTGIDGKPVSVLADLVIAGSRDAAGAYTVNSTADITEIAKAMGMTQYTVSEAAEGESYDFKGDNGKAYRLVGDGSANVRNFIAKFASKNDMGFYGSIRNGVSFTGIGADGKAVTAVTDVMLIAGKGDKGDYTVNAMIDGTKLASAMGFAQFSVKRASAGQKADFTAAGTRYVIGGSEKDISAFKTMLAMSEAMSKKMGCGMSVRMNKSMMVNGSEIGITISAALDAKAATPTATATWSIDAKEFTEALNLAPVTATIKTSRDESGRLQADSKGITGGVDTIKALSNFNNSFAEKLGHGGVVRIGGAVDVNGTKVDMILVTSLDGENKAGTTWTVDSVQMLKAMKADAVGMTFSYQADKGTMANTGRTGRDTVNVLKSVMDTFTRETGMGGSMRLDDAVVLKNGEITANTDLVLVSSYNEKDRTASVTWMIDPAKVLSVTGQSAPSCEMTCDDRMNVAVSAISNKAAAKTLEKFGDTMTNSLKMGGVMRLEGAINANGKKIDLMFISSYDAVKGTSSTVITVDMKALIKAFGATVPSMVLRSNAGEIMSSDKKLIGGLLDAAYKLSSELGVAGSFRIPVVAKTSAYQREGRETELLVSVQKNDKGTLMVTAQLAEKINSFSGDQDGAKELTAWLGREIRGAGKSLNKDNFMLITEFEGFKASDYTSTALMIFGKDDKVAISIKADSIRDSSGNRVGKIGSCDLNDKGIVNIGVDDEGRMVVLRNRGAAETKEDSASRKVTEQKQYIWVVHGKDKTEKIRQTEVKVLYKADGREVTTSRIKALSREGDWGTWGKIWGGIKNIGVHLKRAIDFVATVANYVNQVKFTGNTEFNWYWKEDLQKNLTMIADRINGGEASGAEVFAYNAARWITGVLDIFGVYADIKWTDSNGNYAAHYAPETAVEVAHWVAQIVVAIATMGTSSIAQVPAAIAKLIFTIVKAIVTNIVKAIGFLIKTIAVAIFKAFTSGGGWKYFTSSISKAFSALMTGIKTSWKAFTSNFAHGWKQGMQGQNIVGGTRQIFNYSRAGTSWATVGTELGNALGRLLRPLVQLMSIKTFGRGMMLGIKAGLRGHRFAGVTAMGFRTGNLVGRIAGAVRTAGGFTGMLGKIGSAIIAPFKGTANMFRGIVAGVKGTAMLEGAPVMFRIGNAIGRAMGALKQFGAKGLGRIFSGTTKAARAAILQAAGNTTKSVVMAAFKLGRAGEVLPAGAGTLAKLAHAMGKLMTAIGEGLRFTTTAGAKAEMLSAANALPGVTKATTSVIKAAFQLGKAGVALPAGAGLLVKAVHIVGRMMGAIGNALRFTTTAGAKAEMLSAANALSGVTKATTSVIKAAFQLGKAGVALPAGAGLLVKAVHMVGRMAGAVGRAAVAIKEGASAGYTAATTDLTAGAAFSLGKNAGAAARSFVMPVSRVVKNLAGAVTKSSTLGETIANIAAQMGTNVKLAGRAIGNLIKAIGKTIGDLVAATGKFIANAIKAVGEAIGNVITRVGAFIGDQIKNLGAMAGGFIKNLGARVGDMITNIGAVLGNTIKAVGEAVGNFLSKFLGAAVGNFVKNMAAAIGNFVKNVTAAIGNFVKNMTAAIGNLVTRVTAAIGNFVKNMTAAIGNFVKNMAAAFGRFVINITAAIGNLITNVAAAIGNFVNQIALAVGNFVQNLISAVGKFVNLVANAIGNFVNGVKAAWANVVRNIAAAVNNFITAFAVNPVKALIGVVKDIAVAIGNFVKDIVTAAWNALGEIFSAAVSAVAEVFSAVVTMARDVLAAVGTFIYKAAEAVFKFAVETLMSVAGYLAESLVAIGNLAREVLTAVSVLIVDLAKAAVAFTLEAGAALLTFAYEIGASMVTLAHDVVVAVATFVAEALAGIYGVAEKLVAAVAGKNNVLRTFRLGFSAGMKGKDLAAASVLFKAGKIVGRAVATVIRAYNKTLALIRDIKPAVLRMGDSIKKTLQQLSTGKIKEFLKNLAKVKGEETIGKAVMNHVIDVLKAAVKMGIQWMGINVLVYSVQCLYMAWKDGGVEGFWDRFAKYYDPAAMRQQMFEGFFSGFLFGGTLKSIGLLAETAGKAGLFSEFVTSIKAGHEGAQTISAFSGMTKLGYRIGSLGRISALTRVTALTTGGVAINLSMDLLKGNISSAGDLVRSVLTGALYGLFAAYVLSPSGFRHLAQVRGNLARLADTETLLNASLAGAAEWIVVSPFFTVFGAMWQSLIDGVFKGEWHGLGMQDEKGSFQPLTWNALIESAIQGPMTGRWMGPVMSIFGKQQSADVESFRLAMSQSHGLISKGAMIARRMTLSGEAWKNFIVGFHKRALGMNTASFITKFILKVDSWLFVSAYVTGISNALGLIGRKHDKEGNEVGAGLSAKGAEFFGWAFLFMKTTYTYQKGQAAILGVSNKGKMSVGETRQLLEKYAAVRNATLEYGIFAQFLGGDPSRYGEVMTAFGDLGTSRKGSTFGDGGRLSDNGKARRKFADRVKAFDAAYGTNLSELMVNGRRLRLSDVKSGNVTFEKLSRGILSDAADFRALGQLFKDADAGYGEMQQAFLDLTTSRKGSTFGDGGRLSDNGKAIRSFADRVKAFDAAYGTNLSSLKGLKVKDIRDGEVSAEAALSNTSLNKARVMCEDMLVEFMRMAPNYLAKDALNILTRDADMVTLTGLQEVGMTVQISRAKLYTSAQAMVFGGMSNSEVARIATGRQDSFSFDGKVIEVKAGMQKAAETYVLTRVAAGDKAVAKAYFEENDKSIRSRKDLSTEQKVKEMAISRIKLGHEVPKWLNREIDTQTAGIRTAIKNSNPEMSNKEVTEMSRMLFLAAKGDARQMAQEFADMVKQGKTVSVIKRYINEDGSIDMARLRQDVGKKAGITNEVLAVAEIVNTVYENVARQPGMTEGGIGKNKPQVEAVIDMLSNPAGIYKMLTGSGKTYAIAPVLSILVSIVYGKKGMIDRIVNIFPNFQRLNSSWTTCVTEALEGIATVESDNGVFAEAVITIKGADGKVIQKIRAVRLNSEALDAVKPKDLLSLVESADVLFTDLMTLNSLLMRSEGGGNADPHQRAMAKKIVARLTEKGWGLYDEAHFLPTAPHLILGADGVAMSKAQISAIETVYKFMDHKYNEWLKETGKKNDTRNNFNSSFKQFVEYLRSKESGMLITRSGEMGFKFSPEFQKQFLEWANKNKLVKNKGFDAFHADRTGKYDNLKAALTGFEDALSMEHESINGFSWQYDKSLKSYRMVPMSDGPAPNMYWGAWNVAGARELVGRRYMEGKVSRDLKGAP